MRLIDADEFKKQIAGMAIVNNYPADKANKMCKLIDCQPTIYDVDKVVECLEYELELTVTQYPLNGKYIKKSRAIEIVESGGIEGR